MSEQNDNKKEPISERVSMIRSFPREVIESLTKEDLNTIMYEEELPTSLGDKLKDYLVED